MNAAIRLAAGLCCLALAPATRAANWTSIPTYYFGQAGVHLGSSIAVGLRSPAGSLQVSLLYVGSPTATYNNLAEAGVVDVYQRNGQAWQYVYTLHAALPQAGAHFGKSMASYGRRVIVGAPDYNDVGGSGANAGYIEFLYDDGATPAAPVSTSHFRGNGGNFGSSVAIHANMAAAGAVHGNGGGGASSGCIYSFRYDTTSGVYLPFPAHDVACGSNGEELGASVAIQQTSGDTFILVAGAPAGTQNGQALAGSAKVFIPNGQGTDLLLLQTLTAQTPAFLDVFGTSVGLDGTYIYVGGTGRDNGSGRSGSVTIFEPASLIGWNYLDEYFPLAPATNGGHCGASLHVDEAHEQFIVGCPNSTGTTTGEGTARVYHQVQFLGATVWLEDLLSFGNILHGADALGTAVDLFGDRAYVGAPNADFPPPQTDNGRWVEFAPDRIFANGFEG